VDPHFDGFVAQEGDVYYSAREARFDDLPSCLADRRSRQDPEYGQTWAPMPRSIAPSCSAQPRIRTRQRIMKSDRRQPGDSSTGNIRLQSSAAACDSGNRLTNLDW
jgi:hypothetical protein